MDKLARSERRELSGTQSNKNQRQFANDLPITHRRFSKIFVQF